VNDLASSAVFLICQLLLLAFIFGVVFPGKPDAVARLSTRPKTLLFCLAACIVVVAALVNVWSSEFGHPGESQQSRLTVVARKGTPMVVRLDEDACFKFDFGSISCATDYAAVYDPRQNRWTVTGYSALSQKVATGSATNSEARPGSLSIWGALFQFDDEGTVFRLDQKIGAIRLQDGPANPR
jgi:hypothetical protein